jgi:hypothetical protein
MFDRNGKVSRKMVHNNGVIYRDNVCLTKVYGIHHKLLNLTHVRLLLAGYRV